MRRRAAMLYARRGQAFVNAESQTVDGFWVGSGPCLVEDLDAPDRISERVLEALAASRLGVPTPSPSEALDTELLQQAGVKSFSAFMNGARAVRITASEQGITVTPMRNGGSRRGFLFKQSEAVFAQAGDELASALVAALDAAE